MINAHEMDGIRATEFGRPTALSPRERECLLWAARGKTYTEIGDILGIKFGTVKTNLDVARYKLSCSTLAQATATAVARGIFTSADLEGRT
jgi:DNA-binding CsgD family transcriptional regulator